MSVPERIPPSTRIFIEPFTSFTISSSTSAVAGHWSSTLPPWLDTMIASAPASFAFLAPFAVITPLTINGLPAGGFIFFRNGSPAASISIATANAPDFFTSSIFSRTVSRFQGFTVGIPHPSFSRIASVAASITFAFTPSPVNAAIPASAQADTSTLL